MAAAAMQACILISFKHIQHIIGQAVEDHPGEAFQPLSDVEYMDSLGQTIQAEKTRVNLVYRTPQVPSESTPIPLHTPARFAQTQHPANMGLEVTTMFDVPHDELKQFTSKVADAAMGLSLHHSHSLTVSLIPLPSLSALTQASPPSSPPPTSLKYGLKVYHTFRGVLFLFLWVPHTQVSPLNPQAPQPPPEPPPCSNSMLPRMEEVF